MLVLLLLRGGGLYLSLESRVWVLSVLRLLFSVVAEISS